MDKDVICSFTAKAMLVFASLYISLSPLPPLSSPFHQLFLLSSIFYFPIFKLNMTKGDALHLAFGVFGNATGLFLFLSPAVTFKRIITKKSTEQFSGIPYVMTLLNCLLAAWYGLPFISKNNYLVSAINGTGAVIESIYVLIFLIYAAKKEKGKIVGLLICILAIFATVALVAVFAIENKARRRLLCGFAATVFSIIMYASPLSVMRMVIKTKSVEYMPFLLSLFVFLCGTSWFIYGLIGNDKFLYIPNGFGCALGAMQLILYAIYRNNKGDTKKPTEESLEMGVANAKPQHQKQPNYFRNDNPN